MLYSIAARLFYIPSNSAQGFQFLHILANSVLVTAILVGVSGISP